MNRSRRLVAGLLAAALLVAPSGLPGLALACPSDGQTIAGCCCAKMAAPDGACGTVSRDRSCCTVEATAARDLPATLESAATRSAPTDRAPAVLPPAAWTGPAPCSAPAPAAFAGPSPPGSPPVFQRLGHYLI